MKVTIENKYGAYIIDLREKDDLDLCELLETIQCLIKSAGYEFNGSLKICDCE